MGDFSWENATGDKIQINSNTFATTERINLLCIGNSDTGKVFWALTKYKFTKVLNYKMVTNVMEYFR
ncbi:hypothetical protein GCM10007423_59620 [Dyadobacter endophyticus]|uniref:Uncharacterized protein n=1 Tax=Dyadobacter endophyticus TaxID=1749036 RepID=A0ABQ1ZAR2_9BACT|nr:hypothetical protein GCM10007423_59620 [Dyadobacter endophyticus]